MSITIEVVEHHREVNSGWRRPAPFSVLDGLGCNFSLDAGVLGRRASRHTVAIAGLAGLIDEARSMASGEFSRPAAPSDRARAEIDFQRRELKRNPDAELKELTYIVEERGLDPALAAQVARDINADDLLSHRLAAGPSFAAFLLGAFAPIPSFLFGDGSILLAIILSLLGLVLTGDIVAKLTARPFWLGGGRQLLLGGISAGVTYGVELLVGTGLS